MKPYVYLKKELEDTECFICGDCDHLKNGMCEIRGFKRDQEENSCENICFYKYYCKSIDKCLNKMSKDKKIKNIGDNKYEITEIGEKELIDIDNKLIKIFEEQIGKIEAKKLKEKFNYIIKKTSEEIHSTRYQNIQETYIKEMRDENRDI